ncbi:hypothetical protein, partial [Reichenbachiella sp.]
MKYIIYAAFFMVMAMGNGCGGDDMEEDIMEEQVDEDKDEETETPDDETDENNESELVEGVDYFLPNIDLNNWKVTLPIGNPTEVKPPEILNYATNETLLPFMYNDSTDG